MSVSTLVGRPEFDVDFSEPEINRDPYPYLKEARELAPVVYNPPTGWWLALTFADAKAVLGGEDRFGPWSSMYDELFGARVFEAMDQPRHDEVRGIWKPHFLRSALEQFTATVETVVEDQLDRLMPRLADGEVVDVFPDFIEVIPAHVVGIIVGAPPEDYALFEEWNRGISALNATRGSDQSKEAQRARQAGMDANAALRSYFAEQIADRRRRSSTEDLAGIMAHSEVELDEEQRRAHLVQLLWAGSDTTAKHLAHTMITLARHPDQRREIVADRSLISAACEESLRYEAVAGPMPRVAREEIEIGGVTIPAGDLIFGHITAANRDPDRWSDPDVFDIHRPPKAHLGFGTGIHSCIGVQLARLEARIWLDRLLDRMPDWELGREDIDYGVNILSRGPSEVPIARV
jgi:cytochrome P450